MPTCGLLFEDQNPKLSLGICVVISYINWYLSYLFMPQLDEHNVFLPNRFLGLSKSQITKMLVAKPIRNLKTGGREKGMEGLISLRCLWEFVLTYLICFIILLAGN